MSKERFQDAEWFTYLNNTPYLKPVVVGGVGGIGSWLVMFLSRIGYKIYAYDMDIVDETNLGGQLYGIKQIDKPKVQAIQEVIGLLSPELSYRGINEKYTTATSPIMFSCFDNMEARKDMFKAWESANYENKLFVDGRMQAEDGMIFFVTPDKIEAYKEHLFEDSDIPDLQCSYKATSHNGAMIASYMVAGVNNWLTNLANDIDLRDVPFKISYNLPLMLVETYENEHKL